ncbi:GTPase activator activity protein [Homalodisca vitripennis]|nr:GTPase activator activity protein [Homalodisca vitripennis]
MYTHVHVDVRLVAYSKLALHDTCAEFQTRRLVPYYSTYRSLSVSSVLCSQAVGNASRATNTYKNKEQKEEKCSNIPESCLEYSPGFVTAQDASSKHNDTYRQENIRNNETTFLAQVSITSVICRRPYNKLHFNEVYVGSDTYRQENIRNNETTFLAQVSITSVICRRPYNKLHFNEVYVGSDTYRQENIRNNETTFLAQNCWRITDAFGMKMHERLEPVVSECGDEWKIQWSTDGTRKNTKRNKVRRSKSLPQEVVGFPPNRHGHRPQRCATSPELSGNSSSGRQVKHILKFVTKLGSLRARRADNVFSTRRLQFTDELRGGCRVERCYIISATWRAEWVFGPEYSESGGGLCGEGEVRSAVGGGSVRIHHLTGVSPEGLSRFPKLEECAHFHYEHVELGPIQVLCCLDNCRYIDNGQRLKQHN